MEAKTFAQGIHPEYNKELTRDKALVSAPVPKKVKIPLQQHIGGPAKPVVEVGEKVALGEKIGEATGFVSANIHASVSGTVIAVEEEAGDTIVKIKNDGEDRWAENIVTNTGSVEELTKQELRDIIQQAGVVGLGGATFPSHVKVSIPEDKDIDTVILNGAECEPYLTIDHRIMTETEPAKKVLTGLQALMKAAEAEQGYIGIEDNKPEAIRNMKKVVQEFPNVEVVKVETKYPQGGEKQLIDSILGREVPSGGLPLDVGVVVNNTGTSLAIAEAINDGKPLIERAVTVTGAVEDPQNFIVRIGTSVEELITECGGFEAEPGKVILGGPMTGEAQSRLDVPVTKGTSGVLVLTQAEVEQYPEASSCIRCARCVDACPIKLMPTKLVNLAKNESVEALDEYNVLDCIECGSCTYVCPANIELVQWIKLGKAKVEAEKRE